MNSHFQDLIITYVSLFTGFDPGEGRVVQIGEGKVFGSAGFVRMWIAGMASRRKDAHEVMGIGSNETVGYSSHGWRLADAQGRITGTSTTDRYGKTTYRDAQGRIQGSKK